jgi:signal transduction histidine kinase
MGVRELTPLVGGMQFVVWQDWTYASLSQRMRTLLPGTVTILSTLSRDQRGQVFNGGDLIASVTRSASAPVYGVVRSWVGRGVVGGVTMDTGDDGRQTGWLLVQVLTRSAERLLPPAEIARPAPVVDWRQLQRWGLSEHRLPPGTEVLFRTPTAWERYRSMILLALMIIGVQALLIARLLLERRRRVRTQRVLEESRAQVAHIGRVATLGELTAAVSHELGQPLSAIRANAVAGARLLDGSPPNVGEARDIFRDIAEDDVRAAKVLERIRILLRKEEPASVPVDLNLVCTQAAQLLENDAGLRGVRIRLSLDPNVPIVLGDAVQLQQVVLNLALNSMDAIQSLNRTGSGEDEVVVGTSGRDGIAELFVRDTGPGLAPEVQQRIFEPFYSTKSHGLGMGLAIVRSIVEQLRGQVRAENQGAGGAVFTVQLPAKR